MDAANNMSTLEAPADLVSIVLPPSLFSNLNLSNQTEISILFGVHSSSLLYPLANVHDENFTVASSIVFCTIVGYEEETVNLTEDVTIVMQLHSEVSGCITIILIA